jgi:hypothetical protein
MNKLSIIHENFNEWTSSYVNRVESSYGTDYACSFKMTIKTLFYSDSACPKERIYSAYFGNKIQMLYSFPILLLGPFGLFFVLIGLQYFTVIIGYAILGLIIGSILDILKTKKGDGVGAIKLS